VLSNKSEKILILQDEDSGYQERLQGAVGLFLPGIVDKVYSSID
jgi:hypothetical protein